MPYALHLLRIIQDRNTEAGRGISPLVREDASVTPSLSNAVFILMDKPSFYAVIPADVRYDKTLSPNAKLLYGEITALCSKEGFCWASNTYFAELYEVAPTTISEWVRLLRDAGHISCEVEPNNTRRIFLKGSSGKAEEGIGKSRRPSSGKAEHINTVSNTSINTTKKEVFGEFKNVLLTVEEKDKLKARYGSGAAKQLVEELSAYIASQGKRYKDHYATLLNWAKRKGVVEVAPKAAPVAATPLTPEQVEENRLRLQRTRESLANKLRMPTIETK